MKTGIIIICHNNEFDINNEDCIKYLNEVADIEFCLVNNNSADNTLEVLKDLSENCKNVSVVNVNSHKSSTSAVRAGARFMFNEYNLKQLGFITTKTLNSYENFGILINIIRENQHTICNYNKCFSETTEIKLTLFQRLFPVMDYLEINSNENSAVNRKRLQTS